MGLTGQLSFWDASAYHQGRLGDSVDWWAFWTFEGTPGRDSVDAHLESRLPSIAAMRRRIVEIPGHVDRPYWVTDATPLSELVTHIDAESMDWATCMDTVGKLLATPLDSRKTAWKLYVFHGVTGCPHTAGPATFVVGHISHTMMTGSAFPSMSKALFADGTEVLVDGLPAARDKALSPLAALARSAAAPFKLVPFGVRLAKTKRTAAPAPAGAAEVARTFESPTYDLPPGGGDRTLRFVEIPTNQLRGGSTTVTVGALTAVSKAMQTFAERESGEPITQVLSNVVIAVPDADYMGVNRLGYSLLNLRGDLADLKARSAEIAAALATARDRIADPARAAVDAVQGRVPFLLYRMASAVGRKRTLAAVRPYDERLYTALTSLVASPAGCALAGAPMTMLSVYQGGSMGLTHSMCGSKESVTIAMVAQRGVISDIDQYAADLQAAAVEVGKALN